jgi:hypothetical protein
MAGVVLSPAQPAATSAAPPVISFGTHRFGHLATPRRSWPRPARTRSAGSRHHPAPTASPSGRGRSTSPRRLHLAAGRGQRTAAGVAARLARPAGADGAAALQSSRSTQRGVYQPPRASPSGPATATAAGAVLGWWWRGGHDAWVVDELVARQRPAALGTGAPGGAAQPLGGRDRTDHGSDDRDAPAPTRPRPTLDCGLVRVAHGDVAAAVSVVRCSARRRMPSRSLRVIGKSPNSN